MEFGAIGFQFLHGAIKREYELTVSLNIDRFQFLHGAIKRDRKILIVTNSKLISIPTWCD